MKAYLNHHQFDLPDLELLQMIHKQVCYLHNSRLNCLKKKVRKPTYKYQKYYVEVEICTWYATLEPIM